MTQDIIAHYKFIKNPVLTVLRRGAHGMDCVISACEAIGMLRPIEASRLRSTTKDTGVLPDVFMQWLDDWAVERAANVIIDQPTNNTFVRHKLVNVSYSEFKQIIPKLPNGYGTFVGIQPPVSGGTGHILMVVRWDNQLGILDPQVMESTGVYNRLAGMDLLDMYAEQGYSFMFVVEQTVRERKHKRKRSLKLRHTSPKKHTKRRRTDTDAVMM